jgi:DNA-binding MarR family transcriptional regulator
MPKAPARGAFSSKNEAWRRTNVGRAIFDATRTVERDVLAALGRAGFPQIRAVHLSLFRNLDLDGTRLTELAHRANMTKQSMQELVDSVQALGLIERRPDPGDRRAKIVAFSRKGLQLLDALHTAVLFMEARMADTIGPRAVRQITRLLNLYNSANIPERGAEAQPAARDLSTPSRRALRRRRSDTRRA